MLEIPEVIRQAYPEPVAISTSGIAIGLITVGVFFLKKKPESPTAKQARNNRKQKQQSGGQK